MSVYPLFLVLGSDGTIGSGVYGICLDVAWSECTSLTILKAWIGLWIFT